jgi:hypothetical protein
MKQLKNIGVFLFRNWQWPNVLTWHDILKKFGYVGYVYAITKNDPLMVNVKFACQLCQSWQPEMRLDHSGTKIIQIFIVTNRFSHSWSRCTYFTFYKI